MVKIIILAVFMASIQVNASAPTLESLLRNGNNPEIGSNTVIANLKIKQVTTVEGVIEDGEVVNQQAIKYLINNEREEMPLLYQLEYSAGRIETKSLYSLKTIKFDNLKKVNRNKEKLEQRVYHSLMAILLRNDAGLMMDFLREQGIQVKDNKQLVNRGKAKLLQDYKYYLKGLKEEIADLTNPLKPEDEEKKKKIAETMKAKFLKDDNLVTLRKSGDKFNWVVESEKLFISFTHDHKIEEMVITTLAGKIKISLGRFLLQGSSLQFPEFINITVPSGNKFEIKLVSLKLIKDTPERFAKRIENYEKAIKENLINVDVEPSLFTL
jgi:hypothetical protein